MKNYDVAIIGGGPIGGLAAQIFSCKGYNVSIFEKKGEIGEPVNCAGLVSKRVLELTKINTNTIVQNEIKGANIHSPFGNNLKIGGDKYNAFVINRKLFDREIINKAQDKGVKIFLKNKFIKAKIIDNNIEFLTSKKQKYKCKFLVGADGPNSTVRDIFSFQKPRETLKGIGAEIENTNLDPDFVEIFIGSNIAPGFFAWIIPTNRDGSKARIGLCIKDKTQFPVTYYFNSFLRNKLLSDYFKNIKIMSKNGGLIPIGPIKPFVKSNIILIGDAAAQVKPTSGGGLYPGLMCANYCNEISIESNNVNNFDTNGLKKYVKLCQTEVINELEKGMKFRKLFLKLNDVQLDYYIRKFQNEDLVKIITKYGDIDYPSKLGTKLLKKSPSLIKIITNLLR